MPYPHADIVPAIAPDTAAYAGRLGYDAHHVDAAGALYAIRDAAAALQKARPEIVEFSNPHAMGLSDVLDILHDMASDIAGSDAKWHGAA